MKKLIALALFTLLSFNTVQLKAYDVEDVPGETDAVDPTSYAITNSDYTRIEQDENGNWFGIIEITEYEVIKGYDINYLVLKFSRELDNLMEVSFDWKFEGCETFTVLGFCALGMYRNDSGIDVVFNTHVDGSFSEFMFSNDRISTYDGDAYDYSIIIPAVTYIGTIDFRYSLTEEEIIDLKLDYQEQYNNEVDIINNNLILTEEDRDIAIADLNEEYAEFEVAVFENDWTSTQFLDYTVPDENTFFDNIFDSLKVFFITAFIIIALGVIGFAVVSAAFDISIYVAMQSIKGVLKEAYEIGVYYSKHIYNGSIKFVNVFLNAFNLKI